MRVEVRRPGGQVGIRVEVERPGGHQRRIRGCRQPQVGCSEELVKGKRFSEHVHV